MTLQEAEQLVKERRASLREAQLQYATLLYPFEPGDVVFRPETTWRASERGVVKSVGIDASGIPEMRLFKFKNDGTPGKQELKSWGSLERWQKEKGN